MHGHLRLPHCILCSVYAEVHALLVYLHKLLSDITGPLGVLRQLSAHFSDNAHCEPVLSASQNSGDKVKLHSL